MKKYKILLAMIVVNMSVSLMNAQIPGFELIYGNTSDTKIILQEYMRPYANIMGANLNAGWYNTAKPHKLGGFDITATVSVAFAPSATLTYDVSQFENLNASIEGSSNIAPTVAGDMETPPELVYSNIKTSSGVLGSHELKIPHPNGTGINYLPLPMGQATIGLFKGTDITLRYVPDLTIGEYGEIGVFGLGGRHSISQWIPVLKRLKFINIALQGGYTKVETSAHMKLEPEVEVPMPDPPNFDDQFLNMNLTGWTVNLIASQSIPVITVYEGIGFSSSAADLAMLGKYPKIVLIDEGENIGKTTYQVVEDPIEELSYENKNNLRLNAGIRFKLGVLTIHYDFTKTLYATHTAGLGISFR